jgi:hypothetical protein
VFTTPNKAFIAFNSSGSVPDSIPSGIYKGYISGTAIKNCLVKINGEHIKNQGEIDINIKHNEPFKELKIDCSKGNGGIKGNTYDINFSITIDNTLYTANKIEIIKVN